MQRRMAAVLVADIVDYSGMMEADEEGTARHFAGSHVILDNVVATHDGRLFKAMGDAVLVEFVSPINALKCAAGIKDGLDAAREGDANTPRMRFGLHLAVVMVDGDDLIGDGVNISARIQQAADPDTIDISAAMFEQIRRNSPFAFDECGEQNFKHIGEPIRIYRLLGEIGSHVVPVAAAQPAAKPAKCSYSVALLPFEGAGSSADQAFLADGLIEELIFELGRFKKLFVTSRTATWALDGAMTDPQAVGDRLGVRHVHSGSVRQLGAQVRMTLSLAETDTGTVVWSARLNQTLESLIAWLDALVARVAATVLGRIEERDMAAARRLKPQSMTAFEFYLRRL